MTGWARLVHLLIEGYRHQLDLDDEAEHQQAVAQGFESWDVFGPAEPEPEAEPDEGSG